MSNQIQNGNNPLQQKEEPFLVIRESELNQILTYIGEIPNKYAEPIKNAFIQISNLRAKEQADAQISLESKLKEGEEAAQPKQETANPLPAKEPTGGGEIESSVTQNGPGNE